VNNVTITLSNEEMTKIKVVDLEKLSTLQFKTFSFELIYCFKM